MDDSNLETNNRGAKESSGISHSTLSRRQFLFSAGAGAVGASSLSAFARTQEPERPNMVVVMADDMGFSDAGCYGGEIRTPNIDRLAKNGLRFTQFYNCARCCPTRASLLTGQYPHRVGLAKNGQSLTRNGLTAAEALKEAGYQTAMAGKWHLSFTPQLPDKALHQKWLDRQHDPGRPFAPVETYPVNRGFDKHYGIIWGVVNYFDPFSLVDGTKAVEKVPKDYYITDAITEKSVEYIEDFAKSDKPFFLYVAHCAPHWPLHARPGDIARYEGMYDGGWDKLRRDRFARQLEMGLFEKKNTPLPPVMDGGKPWDKLTADEKKFQAKKMAVHAAMVDRMDQGIGKILDALEKTGKLDDTLILFLSDNGASPEVPQQPGYDRTGQTRDGRAVRYKNLTDVGSETTYTGFGPAWANAANTPFRYWKKESFEGGCHTPLIAHWPNGLGAEPGSITDQLGHVMDVLPTFLDLAGATYPDSYKGHKLTAMTGMSLAPIFAGKTRRAHKAIFFEHVGGRAVRMGDWKLVALSRRPWELYNLAEDRTETRNLAAERPEVVQTMSGAWDAWAKRNQVPAPPNRRPRTGKPRS